MGKMILRQRRMGVEPTRDRAERPLSRFEDGETHRGPYTSICLACSVLCHSTLALSSERLYLGGADLQKRLYHQLGLAQARQIPITRDRETAHTRGMSSLNPGYCVLDHQA
jgi:hypothetical protein